LTVDQGLGSQGVCGFTSPAYSFLFVM